MPSMWLSKPMWRAVLLTVVIHFIYEIATRHIWKNVWLNFKEMADYVEEDPTDEPDVGLFTITMFKTVFFNALLLPLDYRWQTWLESTFPSRPRPKTEYKDKPMTDVSEALEDEIMRRLIAEGKVQRASLRWGNILIKIIVDFVAGSIIGGLLWTPLSALKRFDHKILSIETMTDQIFGQLVGKVVGGWFFISILKFILVPVEHRLPFEAAMDLLVSVFVGAFLNVVVPWFTTTEAFKAGRAQARAQEAFLNATKNANTTSTVLEIGDGTEVATNEL